MIKNLYRKLALLLTLVSTAFFGVSTASAAYVPNDNFFPLQHYLKPTNIVEVWNQVTGKNTSIVAVLDTVIDTNHPDLRYYVNYNEVPGDGIDNDNNGYIDDRLGWDFVDGDNNVNLENLSPDIDADIVSHGTLVSGIIGAVGDNYIGIAGMNWRTQIMPIRIANNEGFSQPKDIAAGIRYAVNNGADVINISLVGEGEIVSPELDAAIEYAYQKQVPVIVAAGNGSEARPQGINLDDEPVLPVCYGVSERNRNWVIGVSGTNLDDTKAVFSNYGSQCVDIAAPAVTIFSTILEGEIDQPGYGGFYQGTSFAAPIITGAAAYLYSINNTLTVDEVAFLLSRASDQINNVNPSYAGKRGGRINMVTLLEEMLVYDARRQLFYVTSEEEDDYKVKVYSQDKVLLYILDLDLDPFYKKDQLILGDINNDGNKELIVSAVNEAGEAKVYVFTNKGRRLTSFFPYPGQAIGVNMASLDWDKDGTEDLAIIPQYGNQVIVQIVDMFGQSKYRFALIEDENSLWSIEAGDDTISMYVGLTNSYSSQIRGLDRKGDLVQAISLNMNQYRREVHFSVVGSGFYVEDQDDKETIIKKLNRNGVFQGEFTPYKGFSGPINMVEGTYVPQAEGIDSLIVSPKFGGGADVRRFEGLDLVERFLADDPSKKRGAIIGI